MEDTLRELINDTLELRKSWEQMRLEAENQVKALDAKLAAYQTALKDYWEYIDTNNEEKLLKCFYFYLSYFLMKSQYIQRLCVSSWSERVNPLYPVDSQYEFDTSRYSQLEFGRF